MTALTRRRAVLSPKRGIRVGTSPACASTVVGAPGVVGEVGTALYAHFRESACRSTCEPALLQSHMVSRMPCMPVSQDQQPWRKPYHPHCRCMMHRGQRLTVTTHTAGA